MAGVKKGKPTWRPASQILDVKPPEGRVGRWLSTEPTRLARKRAEGWELEEQGSVTFEGVKQINGTPEYRGMVYATMPKELAEARGEYYEEITRMNSITPAQRAVKEDPAMADFITDETR